MMVYGPCASSPRARHVLSAPQVRPKVLRSTHYCPATAKFTSKEYRDLASIGGVATGSAYPTKVHGTPTDRRHCCTHGR